MATSTYSRLPYAVARRLQVDVNVAQAEYDSGKNDEYFHHEAADVLDHPYRNG